MLKYLPLFLLVITSAEARDRNGQGAIGAGAGLAMEAPWASDAFSSAVGPGPKLSFLGRYHHASSYTGFELTLDYFQMSKTSLASRSLSLSFFTRFLPEGKIHPMFSVGTGISRVQSFFRSGDSDEPFIRLRAGAEIEMTEEFDLALHLDHFTIMKDVSRDPNLNVLAPSVSLIYYFGSPPPAVPAQEQKAASTTPTSAAHSMHGPDSDGDGVPDATDLCKGTPKNSKVNLAGCAPRQSFERKLALKFAPGSAQMESSDESDLAELAKILTENQDMKVEIQAHTDNRGPAAKNRRLSKTRAESVRQILIRKFKVNGSRIVARGYGASQPVDLNNSAESRENNSRIIAKISR